MATLKIHPIEIYSKGRNRVLITGISPTDHDCIVGEMWTKLEGPIPSVWNLSGLRRGGTHESNIDMSSEELKDLSKLAVQLGARG